MAREIDQDDDGYASGGGCDELDDDEEALFMPEVVGRTPNGGAGSFDDQLDQLEVMFSLPSFLPSFIPSSEDNFVQLLSPEATNSLGILIAPRATSLYSFYRPM